MERHHSPRAIQPEERAEIVEPAPRGRAIEISVRCLEETHRSLASASRRERMERSQRVDARETEDRTSVRRSSADRGSVKRAVAALKESGERIGTVSGSTEAVEPGDVSGGIHFESGAAVVGPAQRVCPV